MNIIQKSEAIKAGLRKGFQDGSSKMAHRKCYGYEIRPDGELTVNPEEAQVVCWIFEQYLSGKSLKRLPPCWSNRASFLQQASPNGVEKRLTSYFPTKSTLAECYSRKQLATALRRLKTMVSWNGISIPEPMRPLFLMRCSWRYSRRSSSAPKFQKTRLP